MNDLTRTEKLLVWILVAIFLQGLAVFAIVFWSAFRTERSRQQVDVLYTMHDRVDNDGVPLWYVPRSSRQMDLVLELLRDNNKLLLDLEETR